MRAALLAVALLAAGLAAATPLSPAPGRPAPTEAREDELAARLPAPLPGWTAGEPEAGSGPAALLGGGPSAARRYRAVEASEKTVDLEVATGSALVESLSPLLADSSGAAASPGASVVEVRGRPALLRVSREDRSAEVSLVLRHRTLVVVRALGVDGAAEALAYARALDVAGLEAVLGP